SPVVVDLECRATKTGSAQQCACSVVCQGAVLPSAVGLTEIVQLSEARAVLVDPEDHARPESSSIERRPIQGVVRRKGPVAWTAAIRADEIVQLREAGAVIADSEQNAETVLAPVVGRAEQSVSDCDESAADGIAPHCSVIATELVEGGEAR